MEDGGSSDDLLCLVWAQLQRLFVDVPLGDHYTKGTFDHVAGTGQAVVVDVLGIGLKIPSWDWPHHVLTQWKGLICDEDVRDRPQVLSVREWFGLREVESFIDQSLPKL